MIKKRKHQRRKVVLVVILILAALCVVSFYRSNHTLQSSKYTIDSRKAAGEIRIVQITDLHNAVFGNHNKRLVRLIKNQQPDLIVMTGDMVNDDEADLSVVTGLIRNLTEIVPVYYSIGNQEVSYEKNYPQKDLTGEIEAAGAVVLEREYQDIEVNGTAVRIGGIYGYCPPATDANRAEFVDQPDRTGEMDWLLTFQDTDRLKLLLCHMPVCWMINGSLEYYDIDVVFTGHAHGGQVRLPFVGGLYAPDQGWFPGREEGLYTEDAKTADNSKDASVLVLSRGLGSEMKIPRFCNVPQVVALVIQKGKEQ